jgi:uncharacterized membrane protein
MKGPIRMTDAMPSQPEPNPQPQTATALDPSIGGLLSYLLFGWIGGLIMYLTQSHREVRFHAAQSVLLSIAFFALYVAMYVVGAVLAIIPGVGFLASIVMFIASVPLAIAGFVLWIVLCIKGYNLEHFKLPFIGDMAETWAAK